MKQDAVMPFRSIGGPRASTEIVRQIQDAIFGGRYGPGDKLPPERELITQFGVSKVTVREALRILETYGLVEIHQGAGGGVFVRKSDSRSVGEAAFNMLSLNQFRVGEVYECLLCLEPSVAELACKRADADDIAALERSVQNTRALVEAGQRTTEESGRFHMAVARASKNRVNELILGSLLGVLALSNAQVLGTPEADCIAVEDHAAVLEAIRQRNGAEARSLMWNHARRVSKAVTPTKKESPQEAH